MKKQIVYSSAIALAMLTGFTGIVISNAQAEPNTSTESAEVLAINTELSTKAKQLDNKNEMVYVITDANGATKSTFIGSTIYNGDEALPFGLEVKYYLDGTEVSASEIAGKSGRVKILFKYTSEATRLGKKVPFVAVTGLQLDSAKFSNVKVTNGKIVGEGENYTIAGYGVPGANEDLGIDFLPEEFTIEADTSNFTLGTTYTVLMNDLIADLDTSKLTDIDSLIGAVNQLASGLDQIIAGSSSLANGATSLYDGAKALQAGAAKLADGATKLADGSAQLSTGMNTLVEFNNGVITKIDETTTEVTEVIQELVSKYGKFIPQDLLDCLNAKVTKYYNIAYNAVTTYTGNIELLADGAGQVANGANELANGANQLKSGVDQLTDGAGQLASGSQTLYNGLVTFKTSGIDRLVSFANNDLDSFVRNARQTVTAAGAYRNFGGANAESVKFIVKTASIK